MSHAIFAFTAVLTVATVCAQIPTYFPPDPISDNAEINEMLVDYYTRHLVALKEKSLWTLSREQPSAEVYRFLWLRSFNHSITIRVAIRQDGSGILTAKETNGRSDFYPGKLIRDTDQTLTADQLRPVLAHVNSLNLWSRAKRLEHGPSGCDGARWIMEGTRNGVYRMVDVWSPGPGNPMRALGVLLLQAAKFRIPADELY